LNKSLQVDQKVYLYDATGDLKGMARVPLASQYVSGSHSIAINPNNEVYTLVTKPDGGEVHRLPFRSELSRILMPLDTTENQEDPPEGLEITDECVSRTEMLAVGLKYINFSKELNSYHINDPRQECTTRTKPRYLGAPGLYSSALL